MHNVSNLFITIDELYVNWGFEMMWSAHAKPIIANYINYLMEFTEKSVCYVIEMNTHTYQIA